MSRKPMATRRRTTRRGSFHYWSPAEIVIAVAGWFTVIMMVTMTTAVLMGY